MNKLLGIVFGVGIVLGGCGALEAESDRIRADIGAGVVSPTPAPSPALRTGTPESIAEDVGSAQEVIELLAALQGREISSRPMGPSLVPWLISEPGQAYTVAGGWLHIHAYPSVERARAISDTIPEDAGVNHAADWVDHPHFYRCGRLIALYVGRDSNVTTALRDLCGPPFAEGNW